MQADSIIEKAKKLGIDTGNSVNQVDKLRTIANQLGVEDLAELEETLDRMLQGDQTDQVETLDDTPYEESGYVDNQGQGRFGEAEYNQAKNKDGVYDKNYYANRGKELDEKVESAKQEKNKDWKMKDKNDKGPVKADGSNTTHKSKWDKAKDNANLIKAKNDRFQNKISSAKAKAYNIMHPGEALKDTAKSVAKNATKKTAKVVAQATKKAIVSFGKWLIGFIATHPYIAIIVGVVLFIFFLIIIFFGGSGSSRGHSYGIYGYDYVEPICTEITIESGAYAGTYDIEEYVAGVTYGEFGVFIGNSWNEAAKAGSIAARSFVQANVGKDCSVISSESFQVYKTPTESAIALANETRGLVLVDSAGNIKSTQYDAFCTSSPQDDPDNYVVCQKQQRIPRIWVDSQGGIADSWKDGTMSGAHGNGMSAWGAAYLAEQGYSYKEILEYYYDNVELMSIYESFQISNNWTQRIDTTTSSSIKTTILRTPINKLLSQVQYNELNNLIYESVVDAGIGTRSAVVAAAVTPIKYLAENYNVVIPYTLGGGHYMTITSLLTGENIQKTTTTYYGVDPDWGSVISHTWNGNYYDEYGPDCSSWVPWVYYNAGINITTRLAGDFVNLGTKHNMGGNYVAQPGDFLENDGHITVVVGVDEPNQTYYIAHASGGNYGTIITPVSFDSSSYYIVEMTDYIESNKLSEETYNTNYINGVLDY